MLSKSIKRLLIGFCVTFPLVGIAADNDADKPNESKPPKKEEDSSLYLESTFVGDKEQPTVSYFIPWKDIGTPDKLNWNIEQKNDRTLDLIDRDIMIRSMSIYNELDMETSGVQE